MTDVQLSYINDGNKHCQLHKPPQTTMQKLSTAQNLYIITLLDSSLSGAQIHNRTGFNSAAISCICSQHHSNLPKSYSGCPAKLTMTNIDYASCIIHMGKVDNAVEATKTLQNITNTPIYSQTVCHQLKARGMKAVVKRPFLKPHHGRARMEFAERHLEWTIEDWMKVWWSDETKINHLGSNGRKYVWKDVGEGLSDGVVEGTVKF